MTEDNSTTAEQTTIKTGLDLEVEKLKTELAELKTRYDTELSEALQANRELWAELHPVQDPPTAPVEQTVQEDAAEQSFYKTLGISRDERDV